MIKRMLKASLILNIVFFVYKYIAILFRLGFDLQMANSVVPKTKKRKLAIIGCGPSINNLPCDFFDKLSDFDIAALSFSALLPIKKVNYYFYEIPHSEVHKYHKAYLYPYLIGRKGQIENVIVKNARSKQHEIYQIFPAAINSISFNMHLGSSAKIKKILSWISKFKMESKYFFQFRGSLFSICYWANAVDYEEILLVGIDLSSSEYFYEVQNKWLNCVIPTPYSGTLKAHQPHPTNDDSEWVKIEDAMAILKSQVKARIVVENKSSVLAKFFDVYRS